MDTTAISIPYYAPSAELPAPLPSREEIINSKDIISEIGAATVVRVGAYVVKFGDGVDVIEGENMIYVAKHTKIPVPRVYAIYTEPDGDFQCGYIVMEHIAGNSLAKEWESLTAERQLRNYMDQLRALPSPGYYGSIGGRGLLDGIFWTGSETDRKICGPFKTQEGFNNAMINKYTLSYSHSPHKAEFYLQTLPKVLLGDPVFSHGDFQRKNIIVRRIPRLDITDSNTSQITETNALDLTIIDWEYSGWYPTYWDYALAIASCGAWKDDWYDSVRRILDPFLNEYIWMNMLRIELWS